MAPTLFQPAPPALPPIMSSQTRLPSILKQPSSTQAGPKSPFQFGSTTTISVGKDNIDLEVLTMAPASGEQFMRSTCFEHLISTLETNRRCFTASELTTALNSTLPFSTTTASDSAHHACSPLLSAPFDITNLQLAGFRSNRGADIAVASDFITNRPANICYVSLDCTISPIAIDSRITQPPFSFNFCLRLPQSTQQSSSTPTDIDGITDIPGPSSPASPSNTKSFQSIFDELNTEEDEIDVRKIREKLLHIKAQQFKQTQELLAAKRAASAATSDDPTPPPNQSSPSLATTPTVQQPTSFDALLAPKMTTFLGKNVSNLITSYFGPLNFLDDQSSFDSIFGTNPPLLHINNASSLQAGEPIENSLVIPRRLHSFFQDCKYDVFVCICRDDYVGSNFIPDNSHAIQAICSKIQSFTMQYSC